jgi:hypothetical protein
VARSEDAARHPGSHPAESDETDVHVRLAVPAREVICTVGQDVIDC